MVRAAPRPRRQTRACALAQARARSHHQAAGQRAEPSSHRRGINMSAKRATWDSNRIELMTCCFHAGLSCGQIAGEIGVTRNAVIGKLHRLGLTRPSDIAAAQVEQRRAARHARAKPQRNWRPKRSRLSMAAQHEMLKAAFPEPQTPAEDIPILNGRGCTLLELGQRQCRWPISSPGATDFCFCGNEPVKGLSYCPGHARIAYRQPGRRRSSVSCKASGLLTTPVDPI